MPATLSRPRRPLPTSRPRSKLTYRPNCISRSVTDSLPRLQRNLWHFNKIARENGGNRAFGLPGYDASAEYILERAQKRFATTMDTWKQYFNHTFVQVNEISVTGPDGE